MLLFFPYRLLNRSAASCNWVRMDERHRSMAACSSGLSGYCTYAPYKPSGTGVKGSGILRHEHVTEYPEPPLLGLWPTNYLKLFLAYPVF